MKILTRILKIILFLAYAGTVIWLCFGTFETSADIPREIMGIPIDKCIHFAMFLPFPILSFLSYNGFSRKFGKALAVIALAFLAGAILAAGTELGQGLTSYRSADSHDFLADLIGLGVGALCLIITKSVRKQE